MKTALAITLFVTYAIASPVGIHYKTNSAFTQSCHYSDSPSIKKLWKKYPCKLNSASLRTCQSECSSDSFCAGFFHHEQELCVSNNPTECFDGCRELCGFFGTDVDVKNIILTTPKAGCIYMKNTQISANAGSDAVHIGNLGSLATTGTATLQLKNQKITNEQKIETMDCPGKWAEVPECSKCGPQHTLTQEFVPRGENVSLCPPPRQIVCPQKECPCEGFWPRADCPTGVCIPPSNRTIHYVYTSGSACTPIKRNVECPGTPCCETQFEQWTGICPCGQEQRRSRVGPNCERIPDRRKCPPCK